MKTCSRCKAEKSIGEFTVDRETKDGLRRHCRVCDRDYALRWRENNPGRAEEISREFQTARKTWLADQKRKRGCLLCGESEPYCLHFHHLRDKKFILAHGYWRKQDVLEEEIKKCVVLCANCHAKVHAGILTLPDHTEGQGVNSPAPFSLEG